MKTEETMTAPVDAVVMRDQWQGCPIYKWPSACRDKRNTWRVFHRDQPGLVVAEFYGPDAKIMAETFCRLFGEPDGSKRSA